MHYSYVKSGFKKTAALLLACVMLMSIGAVCSAAAIPADGEEDTVYSRLLAIKAVYPDQYFYFTVDGSACWSASGSNCRLSSIPSRGGLPSGKEAASWEGWSCVGFARYVFYCVFGENFSAATKTSSPVVGDVIHTTGPGSDHCSVFLREDENYWYVFDANWGNGCGVRWEGTISKSKNTLHEVYHAKSYDELPLGDVPQQETDRPDDPLLTDPTVPGEDVAGETHDWQPGLVVLNPTCAYEGEQIFTCSICGETKIDAIPTLEHTWDKGEDNDDGTVTYTCTVCGETKTEAYTGRHDHGKKADYEPGDVDRSGSVTANDARLALRYALGLDPVKTGGRIFDLCDVDQDGKLTASDARIILRIAVGLE